MTTVQASKIKAGPTYRAPVRSFEGVVAAPHHLASLAGVEVLREGGSAVDAAIAANAVMGVVWPHMCGVGGDLFAQVWSASDNRLYGLNASGRSGAAATIEAYRERGLQSMPVHGPLSVTVPGAVGGWYALHRRWGKLEPGRIFSHAIRHAREGFAVSDRLAGAIREYSSKLAECGVGTDVYLPTGQAPSAGRRLQQPDLAASLASIARHGPDEFYRGELGERIVAFLQGEGSLLDLEDFAAQSSDWVDPLRVDYRGARVAELPPNTQGLAVLQILRMLEPLDVAGLGFGTGELVHQIVERKKLAFADRDAYVGDPSQVEVPVDRLLAPDYARSRVGQVGQRATEAVSAGPVGDGDTIYLCTADRDGNVVSLIQSLFNAWGSGVVVPGTGVTLQNRGASFKLQPGHPNALAPRKRPMHTLIPGFALKDGKPWMAFGTRGADGQPQTAVQVLTNVLDFGMNVQAALEAPRWVHGAPSARFPKEAVVVEGRIDESTVDDLRRRGHTVIVTTALDDAMGTAQAIQIDDEHGCYTAGSDPRGDGVALGL